MIVLRISTLALCSILIGPALAAAQGADPNLGRNLSANCFNCHGTNGNAVGAMPSIAAQPREVLIKALQEFKEGKRPATIMHQIAKGYSEAQILAIATYLSEQRKR